MSQQTETLEWVIAANEDIHIDASSLVWFKLTMTVTELSDNCKSNELVKCNSNCNWKSLINCN